MSANTTPGVTKTVTLELTDEDHAILVSALHQAARTAATNAERVSDDDESDAGYAEDQETAAQIALALIGSIKDQTAAASSGAAEVSA